MASSHELTSAHRALVGVEIRVASSETHRHGRCVHCPASRPVAVTDDGNCIARWRRTGAKPAARAVQARPVADATRALVVERSLLAHTLEAVCLERVCPTYAATYGATGSGRYTSPHKGRCNATVQKIRYRWSAMQADGKSRGPRGGDLTRKYNAHTGRTRRFWRAKIGIHRSTVFSSPALFARASHGAAEAQKSCCIETGHSQARRAWHAIVGAVHGRCRAGGRP